MPSDHQKTMSLQPQHACFLQGINLLMSLAEHFNESSFQKGDLLSGQVSPRGGEIWTPNYFHKLANRVFLANSMRFRTILSLERKWWLV